MIDVKLEKFEGPLTLLLQLIEKREMDITRISLGEIADQYIEFIKKSGNIDPDLAADFLIIATKLLYAKSKTLLPYLTPDDEEEEESEDLERRLKMFKEFVDASQRIEEILKQKRFMFPPAVSKGHRKELLGIENRFSPPGRLTKEDLQKSFSAIIEKCQAKSKDKLREERIEYKINIEEKILDIQNKLMKRLRYSFNKIKGQAGSKTEIIVSFLAVLELAKQKSIRIDQEEAFSDIIISK
jgi:segregation and condensation protein A